jgi:hypothetical protein
MECGVECSDDLDGFVELYVGWRVSLYPFFRNVGNSADELDGMKDYDRRGEDDGWGEEEICSGFTWIQYCEQEVQGTSYNISMSCEADHRLIIQDIFPEVRPTWFPSDRPADPSQYAGPEMKDLPDMGVPPKPVSLISRLPRS